MSGTPGRLIIICGLPGAGKTTLARQLEAQLGTVRYAPDEWLQVLTLDLVTDSSHPYVHPQRLTETLLSLV